MQSRNPLVLNCQAKPGWTLLELMLASSISLMICLGVIKLYLFNRQAFDFINQAARVQENGRAALTMLQADIRAAGFIGCAGWQALLADNTNPLKLKYPLQIYTNTANLPVFMPHNHVAGTDALLIQKADKHLYRVIKADATDIRLRGLPRANLTTLFRAGELWLIADCHHAELFKLRGVNSEQNQLIVEQPLHYSYQGYIQTARLEQIIYFIGDTSRHSKSKEPILALYRLDFNAPHTIPIEAVEGVADMRLNYSLAANKQVRAVSVNLLLQSPEPVYPQPVAYTFQGQNLTSRCLTQEWTTKITVRGWGSK